MHGTSVIDRALPLIGAIEGGGTKFICAVARSPQQLLDRITIPTTTPSDTLAACIDFFARMTQRHGPIAAVGLACFGPLQLRRSAPDYGCLQSTPKPGWSHADVVSPIQAALGAPVVLDTDVGAAAEAEWRLGPAQGQGSLAYVTVGTGIGAAIAPASNASRQIPHPEMGHAPVRRDARDSNFPGLCPFHGDCVEGLASGPAILARWGCDLSALPNGHAGRSVIAGYLGQFAASIALLHAVDRIVMGGGVMGERSLLPLIHSATHSYLNGYLQGLRTPEQVQHYITKPALGDDAAIIGALLRASDLLQSPSQRSVSS